MKNTRYFSIAELREMDFPYTAISEEQTDSGRWTAYYTGILQLPDDTTWAIEYQMGLTENQELDHSDLFFTDPVEAVKVELKQVMVQKWLPVDGD